MEQNDKQLPASFDANDKVLQEQVKELGRELYEKEDLTTLLTEQTKQSILTNDELVTMFDMLKAYVRKEYDKCPLATVWMATFAIAYWVWPHDVHDDIKYGKLKGRLDDMAVVALTMCAIRSDVNEFVAWRDEQNKKKLEGVRNQLDMSLECLAALGKVEL